DKAESVEGEQWSKRLDPRSRLQLRPDIEGSDHPPCDEAERDAETEQQLHVHKDLPPGVTLPSPAGLTTQVGFIRLARYTRSIRLDVGIADHLAPLLGVIDNELAELGGRGCIGLQAQIDEPRLELGAGKRLVHQLVEDGDDLRRRVRRRADPLPTARLVARHKFADRWNVGQYRDAFGCRHAQGAQLTGLDVADR